MLPDTDRDIASRIAKEAIQRIEAHGLALTPPNFEFWYTYYSGHNSEFKQAVNELLASNPHPTFADLGPLYDRFISPDRFMEQVCVIGQGVREQSSAVTSAIDEMSGATDGYGNHLAMVAHELARANVESELRSSITGLLESTGEMQNLNASLQKKLIGATDQIRHLRDQLDRVQLDSMIDPLTTVGNRRLFEMSLPRMLSEADQQNYPISLLLIDIDNFKQFNDQHGHLVGDHVLRLVGTAIKQHSRREDLVCRYGGDEFAVVLPNTPVQTAVLVGEKIRAKIMERELRRRSTNERLGQLIVSIGAAQHRFGELWPTLVEHADRWMYVAKRSNRNDARETPPSDEGRLPLSPGVYSEMTWQPDYECGEDRIDSQHRRLFELANALFDPSLPEDKSPQLALVLDTLFSHISAHFSYEESVLQERGYNDFEAHRVIHARLLAEATRIRTSIAAGERPLADLREFLANIVIAEHMFKVDRKFFPLFRSGLAKSAALDG